MWLVHAGNRIDSPDRETPRFPTANIDLVATRLFELLRDLRPDGVVSAAASGADLLLLAAAHELGIPIEVVLPLPTAMFRDTSVADQGDEWARRYDALIRPADPIVTVVEHDLSGDDEWYLTGNGLIIDHAIDRAGSNGTVLALTVAPSSDGESATADFAAKAEQRGLTTIDIDPSLSTTSTAGVLVWPPSSNGAGELSSQHAEAVARRLVVPLLADADVRWTTLDAADAGTHSLDEYAVFVIVDRQGLASEDVDDSFVSALAAGSTLVFAPTKQPMRSELSRFRHVRYDQLGPALSDAEAASAIWRLNRPVTAAIASPVQS